MKMEPRLQRRLQSLLDGSRFTSASVTKYTKGAVFIAQYEEGKADVADMEP